MYLMLNVLQGIYMVVASPRISWSSKSLLAASLFAWLSLPVGVLNLWLTQAYPFSMGMAFDFAMGLMGALGLAQYAIGFIKQHPIHRYSWPRLILVAFEIVVSSSLSIVVENLAVCTMWFGDWYDFYIVQKEVEAEEGSVDTPLMKRAVDIV